MISIAHRTIVSLTMLSFLLSTAAVNFAHAQTPKAAEVVFSHDNLPLGLTVKEFEKKYPQCRVPDAPSDSVDTDGEFFFPLTGYVPSLPGLLPSYKDKILATFNLNGESIPSLGASFSYSSFNCGEPAAENSAESGYEIAVFDSQIAVLVKTVSVVSDDPKAAVEELRTALKGSPSPITTAQDDCCKDPSPPAVYVAYSDVGNIRTVIGVNSADFTMGKSVGGQGTVNVAYIDLALWNKYSTEAVNMLKELESKQELQDQKAKSEL